MNKILHYWRNRLPIRIRLTLLYLGALTTILLLFSLFVYWQLQRRLVAQIDISLQNAASQALVLIETEGDRLVFRDSETTAQTNELLDDLILYVMNDEGIVWDVMGDKNEVGIIVPSFGLQTLQNGTENWRVYGRPISLPGENIRGWLQVSQELEVIDDTLEALLILIAAGAVLALLLAGSFGVFLAARTLRPIDRITRTAQAINNVNQLTHRIDYNGPDDEVGRLAATFDRMLERLQASFEIQQRFTADAAHELRTPLTALKGRIDITLGQPSAPDEYHAAMLDMEKQVDRLIHLSNELLFMARMDQGEQSMEIEEIPLEELFDALLDQISPIVEAKAITIHEDFVPGLTLKGDVDLLIRLFLNLLDNAIKYSPKGSAVTVHGRSERDHVRIDIMDNGPGISSEHLPHLFEPFYRGEADRGRLGQNNEQGGTGLGLAIAQEIVQLHSGILLVESECGRGSTFIVRLPLI